MVSDCRVSIASTSVSALKRWPVRRFRVLVKEAALIVERGKASRAGPSSARAV